MHVGTILIHWIRDLPFGCSEGKRSVPDLVRMGPVWYAPLVAYEPLVPLVVGLVAADSPVADKSFILEGCRNIMRKNTLSHFSGAMFNHLK